MSPIGGYHSRILQVRPTIEIYIYFFFAKFWFAGNTIVICKMNKLELSLLKVKAKKK